MFDPNACRTFIATCREDLLRRRAVGRGLTQPEVMMFFALPAMELLGFCFRDLDRVTFREPVGNGTREELRLYLTTTTTVFAVVEVLGSNEDIDSAATMAQAIDSALSAGGKWAVVTNGPIWRILCARGDTGGGPTEYGRFDLSDPETTGDVIDAFRFLFGDGIE